MDNSKLNKRLGKIWQSSDFTLFFEKFSKKGPFVIKKETILFNEGQQLDNLYFIKEGFVKLYRMSDQGKEAIIYLYGPGHILGVRAFTSEDECAKHSAAAITDLKILTISRKDYFTILGAYPEYLVDLLHVFIDRLNYTERKLAGFILTDVVARVSAFLADCFGRFGDLPFSLTHQRIAEFVGAFRETVTLAIQKLEKEKVISLNKGRLKILDLKKLHKYAGL